MRKESIHNSILQVMSKSKKSIRVNEITKKVLAKRKIKGKTPAKTISAILQRSTFVRSRSKRGFYTIIKKPIF